MCGQRAADQLALIPVSNDTVTNRIFFSLQLDESTDIAGEVQLLVYVRFVEWVETLMMFLCYKIYKYVHLDIIIFSAAVGWGVAKHCRSWKGVALEKRLRTAGLCNWFLRSVSL